MTAINTEIRVIGAQIGIRRQAPFSCAPVAFRKSDTEAVIIRHSGLTTHPRAFAEIQSVDWRHLVDTDEAIELEKPMVVTVGAVFWVLRPSLPFVDDAIKKARDSDALLHHEQRGETHLCVVKEHQSASLLDVWARAAFDRAAAHLRNTKWVDAHNQALAAWTLERDSTLERTALLALTLMRLDRASEADDILVSEIAFHADENRLRSLVTHYGSIYCQPAERAGQAPVKKRRRPIFPKQIENQVVKAAI